VIPNANIAYNAEGDKFKTKQLLAVIKDVKTYFFSFIQSAAVLGVSVVGSFLPTFIHDFGFSPGKGTCPYIA
jgi:hypothetical protein